MRAILAIFVSLGVLGAAGAQPVTLRSVVTLETREVRDQSGQLFSVGGLSGIVLLKSIRQC